MRFLTVKCSIVGTVVKLGTESGIEKNRVLREEDIDWCTFPRVARHDSCPDELWNVSERQQLIGIPRPSSSTNLFGLKTLTVDWIATCRSAFNR